MDDGCLMRSGGRDGCERGDEGRELAVYVCWGGYLEEGKDRMCLYREGRKDCIWVKPDMSVVVVRRLVEEVLGEGLEERGLWYSMKYDRGSMLAVRRDEDVKKLCKGNDDHAYVYVGGEGGVMRRVHETDVGRGCVQDGRSGASNVNRLDGGGNGGGRSGTGNRYGK